MNKPSKLHEKMMTIQTNLKILIPKSATGITKKKMDLNYFLIPCITITCYKTIKIKIIFLAK